MTKELNNDTTRLILARTLYGEARGEGREGMEAVAAVILYRANNPGWWGRDIRSVCLKPWQFSCWNENDPNRALILSKWPGQGDPVFEIALDVADQAMAGQLADRTDGASHYAVTGVWRSWMDGAQVAKVIGGHTFYKGVA